MNKKIVGFSEAKAKAEKYCAYQERSHQEVALKLKTFALKPGEIDEILVHLVQKGFLNEERYAIAFAGGKYRVLGWGRKKIIYRLKSQGINDKIIARALNEIPKDDYNQTVKELIKKKDDQWKTGNKLERMAKMRRFLAQKGFETDLIFEELKSFYKE